MRNVIAALLLLSPLAAAAEIHTKLAVLDFTTAKVSAGQPTMNEAILDAATSVAQAEMEHFGFYKVVSRSDIQAAMGVQAQKVKFGCTDDAACLAEIAGALGVERIM